MHDGRWNRPPGQGRPPGVPGLVPRSCPLPFNPSALFLIALLLLISPAVHAYNPPESHLQGKYEEVITEYSSLAQEQPRSESAHLHLIRALLAVGQYPEAAEAASNALDQNPRSVTLRWIGREAFFHAGQSERALITTREITQLVSQRPRSYRDPSDLVTIGRALLLAGVDPRDILERVYAVAQRAAPDQREVYLASGELALEKSDFAIAARKFDEGLLRFPKDPDLHYGRARAFAEGDRTEMGKSLQAALQINPRHVPSLLLLADHRIDAEDYQDARDLLDQALAVNPHHPDAWAYQAILAHLENKPIAEAQARIAATQFWTDNPRVPHLIGRKLSQKYRFAEGAQLQREALLADPRFLPAQAQLANDLLRLGETAEGWDLIQQVHARDAYDVTAFNLVTLGDTMANFTTLSNEHFIVRLPANEAATYGPRVLDLLERARTHLTQRYKLELNAPTTVEIFSNPADFGVRTFGMPGNPGYLGVCFGRVITANSPASTAPKGVNWEAVLWHELAHVATLQLTANKMPRWLSEGISVVEERLAHPAWGERLTPEYRDMILGEDLTPIARLSAAFLIPKSPQHLQFAYYQSSLVVEFLLERFGLPKLLAILHDLRDGTFINDALESHTAPLDTLESEFAQYARARANSLAPGLSFERPAERGFFGLGPATPAPVLDPSAPGAATNFWSLISQARAAVAQSQWETAQPLLETLASLYPTQTGPDSAHALLAKTLRQLNQPAAERAALERWASHDAGATEAYARLMTLAEADADWSAVSLNAQRFLAVNPLSPLPWRALARAASHLDQTPDAIQAWSTVLLLDPPNPAEARFALSRLTESQDPAAARRHLLEALADAPRHREGLTRLVQWKSPTPPTSPPDPTPPSAPQPSPNPEAAPSP